MSRSDHCDHPCHLSLIRRSQIKRAGRHQATGDTFSGWSPDGSRFAFPSGRGETSEIYVVNADGSGLTNLTNNPADESLGAWAPGGSHIAFSSNRDGNSEIYGMNADGSGLTRLTNNPRPDHDPVWSPAP